MKTAALKALCIAYHLCHTGKKIDLLHNIMSLAEHGQNEPQERKGWEVYIIQAKSGQLYTGITNDFERRFLAHQTKKRGARFFHFSAPDKVLYRETQPNRSEATRRELQIKKMTRPQKLALIHQEFWGQTSQSVNHSGEL